MGPVELSFVNQPAGTGVAFMAVAVLAYGFTLYAALYLLPYGANGAPQLITAGLPMFLVLIAVEMALTKASGFKHAAAQYSYVDTWASIAAGMTQQAVIPLLKVTVVEGALYAWCHNVLSKEIIPDGMYDAWHPAAVYAMALVLYDLEYYFAHRHMHTVSFLWVGHNVHHSSDHYNLSTALRQSWVQTCTSWVWQLPSGMLGIPPAVHITVAQAQTLYQFWVHTCHVRRLGWLEYVIGTPSAHRIHHDRRVHKNFGGMFIVWDIIFGTFADEGYDSGFMDMGDAPSAGDGGEHHQAKGARGGSVAPAADGGDAGDPTPAKPVVALADEVCYFGTSAFPDTWTEPVLQVFAVRRLCAQVAAGLGSVRGPGWNACVLKRILPASSAVPRLRYTIRARSKGVVAYTVVQGVCALAALVTALLSRDGAPAYVLSLYVLAALLCNGMLCDAAPGAAVAEALRLVVIAAVFAPWDPARAGLDGMLGAAACASLPWLGVLTRGGRWVTVV